MPVSKERLYLNRTRDKVVLHGDPEAAFLLLGKGKQVSNDLVKKYGLGKEHMTGAAVPAPVAEPQPEEKAVEPTEAENKAVEAPPENKARVMRESKRA